LSGGRVIVSFRDEWLRVLKPEGTIGMVNFTPEGLFGDFLEALAPYAPPPDGLSPALWGSEEHVQELFRDRVSSLELTRREYAERAANPKAYVELFKQTFGPVVAIYESLADDPERSATLDRDFLEFATRFNSGPPQGPAEYRYEYLLVIARRRS
jgi:hypothetical protein